MRRWRPMSVPRHSPPPATARDRDDLAICLTGGGARAAYQVGVLRGIAKRLPELRFPIISGVSAGAINCAFLAAQRGNLGRAAEQLTGMWSRLREDEVFRVGALPLAGTLAHWGTRLLSGGAPMREVRGLVDTRPLRELLCRTLPQIDGEIGGIADNIERGALRSVAITTHSYTTGQGVTWMQGAGLDGWDRPSRIALRTRLTIDHIMASAALPLVFPAVRLGRAWHGDGGLGQATPLAPAIHLGARRILAISTRHLPTVEEAAQPAIDGYPPPAQVIGAMLNALFTDTIDQDALRLERINALLRKLPESEWQGMRPVDLVVLHPSVDLGTLAANLEPTLPRTLRFLVRGLGSQETKSPDFLSILLFQPEYETLLIELGEADVERQWPTIERLLVPGAAADTTPAATSAAASA